MLIEVYRLKEFLINILESLCVSHDNALLTVDTLVDADLRGNSEQGTMRIFQLISGIKNGTINAACDLKVIRESPSITMIDGQKSIGPIAAVKAIDLAIKSSKEHGVSVSSIINAGHIGSLHYYVNRAVSHNCIAICTTTSSPAVCLPGGRNKFFGTNPIAYAIPARNGPIIADFSTSKVSRGKILSKAESGDVIPEGWCVDQNGLPTTDPNTINNGGALLPFDDGHKATLLSLLISVIAGPLIGGVNNLFVTGTRFMSLPPNKGDFFLALHVPHFTDLDQFLNEIDELKDIIHREESAFYVPNVRSTKVYNRNTSRGMVEVCQKVYELVNGGQTLC